MIIYKVSLKPLNIFYFGKEKYFSNKNDSENAENANYNLKSSYYPQQTAILGLIRKEILKGSSYYDSNYKSYREIYIKNKSEIDKLIGSESFNFNKDKQEFGIIKKISPIFLSKDENYYFQKPRNLFKDNVYYSLEKEDDNFKLSNYDPKNTKFQELIEIKKSNNSYNIGEIVEYEGQADSPYIKHSQVRIKRNKDGSTTEKSYFSQDYYLLNKGYEFVFFVELEKDVLKNGIVQLGGNSSYFRMNVEVLETKNIEESLGEIIEPIKKAKEKEGNIVVISPTYIDDEIHKLIDYGIFETIDFRNSWMDELKFKKADNKYIFADAGTVLWGYDENFKILEKIKSNVKLYDIGYNYCI